MQKLKMILRQSVGTIKSLEHNHCDCSRFIKSYWEERREKEGNKVTM